MYKTTALLTMVLSAVFAQNQPQEKEIVVTLNPVLMSPGCKYYEERYHFTHGEKDTFRYKPAMNKCDLFFNSEFRAILRIRELRPLSAPESYCGVRSEFVDAKSLQYWALKDQERRLKLLGTTEAELDSLIYKTAVHLGLLISRRFKNNGPYADNNCGVPLYWDNYVFRESPSISPNDFGNIYEDVNGIRRWFTNTKRGLPPGLPTLADREVAEKAFDRTHPQK